MPAPNVATLDLSVKKGSKFVQPVEVTLNGELAPFPPGTLAKMQIRTSIDEPAFVVELTTENGGLVVDAGGALVTIIMSSSATKNYAFERGVYDLALIYPDTQEEMILEGRVYVFPSVTR